VVVAEIVPVLLLAPVAGPAGGPAAAGDGHGGRDLAWVVLAGVLAVWHGDVAVVYGIAFG
jgi:hypothetical protein